MDAPDLEALLAKILKVVDEPEEEAGAKIDARSDVDSHESEEDVAG